MTKDSFLGDLNRIKSTRSSEAASYSEVQHFDVSVTLFLQRHYQPRQEDESPLHPIHSRAESIS